MTMQSISRREFLRTTGLVAGAAALAACAVPGAAPAGGNGDAMASEPKTIEFVSGWGGALKPFEEIAQLDGFKALAGEDTVFNVRLVGLEDLAAALAAGDTPDGGSNIDYPGHWARGIVLDCTDYVNGSEIIDPSGVLEPVWNAAVYGSNLIGVPAVEGFMWYGMNYNAKQCRRGGPRCRRPAPDLGGCHGVACGTVQVRRRRQRSSAWASTRWMPWRPSRTS